MINFLYRSFLIFTLFISAAFSANTPFVQAEFTQLVQQGKPVVLHIHAEWCSTCRAQQTALNDLMLLPEFKNLPVLRVNFDTEEALLSAYKVRRQSTFIVFKNGKEVARSTGETYSTAIAALLNKAL